MILARSYGSVPGANRGRARERYTFTSVLDTATSEPS
jgi:hypothetical protein